MNVDCLLNHWSFVMYLSNVHLDRSVYSLVVVMVVVVHLRNCWGRMVMVNLRDWVMLYDHGRVVLCMLYNYRCRSLPVYYVVGYRGYLSDCQLHFASRSRISITAPTPRSEMDTGTLTMDTRVPPTHVTLKDHLFDTGRRDEVGCSTGPGGTHKVAILQTHTPVTVLLYHLSNIEHLAANSTYHCSPNFCTVSSGVRSMAVAHVVVSYLLTQTPPVAWVPGTNRDLFLAASSSVSYRTFTVWFASQWYHYTPITTRQWGTRCWYRTTVPAPSPSTPTLYSTGLQLYT